MDAFDFAGMRLHLMSIRDLVQEIHTWAAQSGELDEATQASLLRQLAELEGVTADMADISTSLERLAHLAGQTNAADPQMSRCHK